MGLLDKVWEMFAVQHDGKTSNQPYEKPSKLLAGDSTDGPYGDLNMIRARIKEHVADCEKVRWSFERNWFRNILYFIGNQWITWDSRGQRWREKRLVRKWIPKPVTNRFATTLATIVATIQSYKVLPSAWPATSDADDMATTEVAERLIPVIDDEIDVARVRELAASWMTLQADCIAFPYYDHGDQSLGTRFIQHYACDVCQTVSSPADIEEAGGKCPACGSPNLSPASNPLDGSPLGSSVPVGRMRVDCLSPLQVYINQDILDIKQQRKFSIMRVYAIETIKALWPESGKNVQPDRGGMNKTGAYFLEALAHITEDGGYFYGRSYVDRCSVFTHIELPSEQFPEGLAVSMAGDETILEVGPCPFFDTHKKEDGSEEKVYYNPLEKFSFMNVPGRLYSKTPAYDLIPKQDQLNRLESLIELAVLKGVYNTWMLPTGSSIQQIAGEPSQMIRWTPSGTGGAKPEVVTQNPVPDALLKWKEMIEKDFEELGGTYDAMKGQVPSGVSAGYAIQLLTERSYGRFAPVFANWERGWVGLYSTLIKLARVYFTEERIRKIRGDSGQWEIQKFKGSDLQGSVDIRVEGGSARPRSKLAEQAMVESMANIGVINPQDPRQQFQIAELFGIQHIVGGMDEDNRAVAREWDSLLSMPPNWMPPQPGMPPDMVQKLLSVPGIPHLRMAVDNHIIHIMDHQKRAKTDHFLSLPIAIQQLWEQHIMDHMMAMAPPPQPDTANGHNPNPTGKPNNAVSKANEQGDKTPHLNRQGGNATLGSGGK